MPSDDSICNQQLGGVARGSYEATTLSGFRIVLCTPEQQHGVAVRSKMDCSVISCGSLWSCIGRLLGPCQNRSRQQSHAVWDDGYNLQSLRRESCFLGRTVAHHPTAEK